MPPDAQPSLPLPAVFSAALQEWAAAQPVIASLVVGVALVAVAYLAFEVTRRYLLTLLARIGSRTRLVWDEALRNQQFFNRLAWAVPLLIVRVGLPYVPALPDGVVVVVQRLVSAAMIIVVANAVGAFIRAFGDIYARSPNAASRPIKSYLQGIVLVVYALAAIVMIAALIDRDPLLILSGIGAASAVLLLVFRDTLLSLVAGMQLTSNDLIRVGDWIEMPQFNADGDVVDIALNTVKVQNWDKTFTVIPTHRFLEHSFKNWRGMQDAGGRRIKRNINIDMSSIRFLEPQEIESLRRFALLRDYFDEKRAEIAEWTDQHPAATENPVNARRLTNVGTFRAYIARYLQERPDIRDDMTFLVRQLQPTAEGLPIELYVFVADVRWAVYEGVQADVFDHLLAILPEFGLRVFQAPSGNDFRQLAADREPGSDAGPS